MKILNMFIFKIFKQLYYSIRPAHYTAIIVTIMFYFIFTRYGSAENIQDNYLSILNTVGILSTFFVFALDKLDFNMLINRYKKVTRVGTIVGRNDYATQGDQITNTFFSFVIVDVLLLGVQYLLFLLNIIVPFLLIMSIVYMMLGFIMIVGTWHGSEIHKNSNQK